MLAYWLRAGAVMVDANVRRRSPPLAAVGIGAASMAGSWIVYDLLCKSPLGKREGLLGLVVFGFITALSWGLARIARRPRALSIHVGTAIGTIATAANVFFVIIPRPEADGDRRCAPARSPTRMTASARKQRSVHNNYFTLPAGDRSSR